MFAVEPVIRRELERASELKGFLIRTATDVAASKRDVRSIEIACEGARLSATNTSSVKVSVLWGVHMIVPRGGSAADELDAAFATVISTLQNFTPGVIAGRKWSALGLQPGGAAVQQPEFIDSGLAEYAVIFETSAVYDGRK